eukprot:CAMPEP_0114585112 /NCGR_PEP_ID=MMETSP0125-20121206/8770_1 /TAXON_ID=485358 ORGANISM="Aristerostoma sp., Strain ATCC 50986" /NCGR_SAMPLE_ID=MMETSP0125 /ASSEMBLY_ACC=CAM_ASM_000245 /LENGTH=42 /DNA_ID= /DNA_START= /DNA_END= /DNA_ORIENTATION=
MAATSMSSMISKTMEELDNTICTQAVTMPQDHHTDRDLSNIS